MVQIKFIRQGSNSVLGGFSAGDIARVSEQFAAHLINEAGVAVYAEPATVKESLTLEQAGQNPVAQSDARPGNKRRRSKGE